MLSLSCLACGTAINWILLPNGFVSTGTLGLALVLSKFAALNYTIIYYGISVLIVVAASIILGKKEFFNIIFISLLYPVVLLVTQFVDVSIIFQDKLVAILSFGFLYGIGGGISYRLGYSYGATDTLGKILKATVMKSVSLKVILMTLDVIICGVLYAAYGLDIAMYAIIGQLVYVNVMNYVAFNIGMKLYNIHIISEKSEEIQAYILTELKRGVTLYHAVGGYTQEAKMKLECACNPRQFFILKRFIQETDPTAFIQVFPIVCVIGDGHNFYKIGDNNML